MHLHASAPMHTEPRSTTLFPYTTLFRSNLRGEEQPVMDNISRRSFLMFATGAISAPDALPPWPEIAEVPRSEEHTSELQSHSDLVCRLLLAKTKTTNVLVQGGETGDRVA